MHCLGNNDKDKYKCTFSNPIGLAVTLMWNQLECKLFSSVFHLWQVGSAHCESADIEEQLCLFFLSL